MCWISFRLTTRYSPHVPNVNSSLHHYPHLLSLSGACVATWLFRFSITIYCFAFDANDLRQLRNVSMVHGILHAIYILALAIYNSCMLVSLLHYTVRNMVDPPAEMTTSPPFKALGPTWFTCCRLPRAPLMPPHSLDMALPASRM